MGYRVDLGLVGGKRTFKNFATKVDAEAFQRKCLKAKAHKNPLVLSDIDAIARQEVLAAISRLKEYRTSIAEAVDFFPKHTRSVKADAIASFNAALTNASFSSTLDRSKPRHPSKP